MRQLLYSELVPWYSLVDPPEDHADEAAAFRAALERVVAPAPHSLLELGAGAGHTALHLKAHFRCTLVDLSPEMSASSRRLNPECEHVVGDMRTVRLGQTFDAVLIHDAIMYMTNEQDLRAAVRTAYEHTRPGGGLIIAPDCVRETFEENTEVQHGQDSERALHFMMWDWDPDPHDDSFVTEFAFLMRDGQNVTALHDRHLQGVFSRATWREVLESTGYQVELLSRPIGDGAHDQVFLGCRR